MKKIYLILAVLFAATVAMAYFYFRNLNTEDRANEMALSAVTDRCGVVFSFDNDKSFYDILGGQDLLQRTLGEEKEKQLQNLYRSFVQNKSIFNHLEGQKSYIGVAGRDGELNYLIATQLKSGVAPASLLKTLDGRAVRIAQTGKTYEVHFADSSSLFVGIHDDLVLISNTAKEILPLLNEVPGNEFSAFIQKNGRFNKNTLANLYVNFSGLPEVIKQMLSAPLSGELNVFKQEKTFAALTYSYSRHKLLFNGNTVVSEDGSYFQLFDHLPAQNLTIDNVFPVKTANYAAYTIDQYESWQKSLHQWMSIHQNEERVKNQVSKIEQEYRINLQQVFPKYFKNQFATFQLNTGEKFGVVALSNGDKVGQLLMDISADYAPEIKIFKVESIPFAYFGEPFKKFERPFYTIIDNYLIMANNASSVQSFLSSYKSNSLLINDESYIEFNDQLSSSATICFYVNSKNSDEIFGRNLKTPYYRGYRSKSGFKSYNAFCYQLLGDQGKFLSNLLLYKGEEKTRIDTTNIAR